MSGQTKGLSRWLLFLTGGVIVIWLLIRIWARQLRFPLLRSMQKALTGKYGEVEAGFLAGRIQQRYVTLFPSRPRFHDSRLQIHVDLVILPVLALYQVLLDKHGASPALLDEVHELMAQTVMNKASYLVRLLKYFPDPFSVLHRVVRFVNKNAFPSSGWVIDYAVDDDQAIAFNISGCLFVDVLAGYGVPELAQVFCQFDDDIGMQFPSQIAWKRETTLARGGSFCDFRYENNSNQVN